MTKKKIKEDPTRKHIFKNIAKNDQHLYDITIDNNHINTEDEDNKFFDKYENKFKCTEWSSSRKNENKEKEGKNISIHFVGYYEETDNDINVEYNNFYSYVCDNKIKNITQYLADKIIDHIVRRSERDKQKSNYILDNRMMNYYKKKNIVKNSNFVVYFLKISATQDIVELYKNGSNIAINEASNKIMKPYCNDIINCLNTSPLNEDRILQNYDIIIELFKHRTSNSKEEWLKSFGEFYSFLVLITIFNTNIFINQKFISNPNSNSNLEIDFFISEHMIAIEIDGKQHKTNKGQELNDNIKNAILDEQNIKLIRVEWESKKNCVDFMNNMYDKICDFLLSTKSDKIEAKNIITRDKFIILSNI
jgi:very-short-patch-repair endonuclease